MVGILLKNDDNPLMNLLDKSLTHSTTPNGEPSLTGLFKEPPIFQSFVSKICSPISYSEFAISNRNAIINDKYPSQTSRSIYSDKH